jgi:hypothetical protein
MTSSGKKEAGGLNTMKGNSTEVLYKWRNTANIAQKFPAYFETNFIL